MSQSWIQQTSSSWEDYEAFADASITSSAPPAQGAGNAARAEDLGLSSEECPTEEEEPGESPTDAYALWFGSDAPESDPEGLEEAWGEEVAELWYTELRDRDWQGMPEWLELLRGLKQAQEKVSNAVVAVEAVDALLSTSAADPGDLVLRRFVAVYDAVRAFLPYVSGASEFMAAVSACLKLLCAQVSNFVALIEHEEHGFDGIEGMNPTYFAAFPGGLVVYFFLRALGNGEPAPLTPAIVDFTMDMHEALFFATGEAPPARRESALGLDVLAEDTLDLPALADWYARHIEAIQRLLYGDKAPMFPSSG